MTRGSWRTPFPFGGKQEKRGRVETDPGLQADDSAVGGTFQVAPQEEQDRLAVPVLKAAWALISRGWCRGYACNSKREPAGFNEEPAFYSLVAALNAAPSDNLHVEYAKRALRRALYEHNLPAWNDHPTRTKREVLRLLERVISGNEPKRRGGWQVTGLGDAVGR